MFFKEFDDSVHNASFHDCRAHNDLSGLNRRRPSLYPLIVSEYVIVRNVISFARFVITNSFSASSICQEFKSLFGERQLLNFRFVQLKAILSEQYNKFVTVYRLDITY